jgi:tRNA1Val (adenine37-N6)-methyltransferase
LAEIIWDLKSNKLEPKRLQMVNGNDNSSPYLVLVEAVKGGKSGLTVLPNLTNK